LLDQQGQRLWRNLTGSRKPIDRNTAAMQAMQMDRVVEEQTIRNIRRYCENIGMPEVSETAVLAYLAAKDGVSEAAAWLVSGGIPSLKAVLNGSRYAADRMMDSYAAGNSDNKALNDGLLTFGLTVLPQNFVGNKVSLNGRSKACPV